MSIIRRAVEGVERRGADPRLEWGSSWIPTNGMVGGVANASGVQMNEDAAMSVSVVHACVRALADDVATLPLRAYKKANDRSKVEIDPPSIIQAPWVEGTLQDWLTQVMVSLTLRGNFFGMVCDRDQRGYPISIKPLHPDDVTARRNDAGKREYRYKGSLIPTDNMLHIPSLCMPGQFVGMDPVSYARHSWGLAASAEQYGGRFFANSAQPSGVIEVPEDLDENEALELARAWKMSHQGIGLSSMPAVLTGGATWKQMSVSPDNAQFLGSRDFQRVEVAAWFGIPLHRLGLQDRTTNVGVDAESAEMFYVGNTLIPWLSRIEQYFSLPSMTPGTITVKFDLSSRLRGNTITRMQAYNLAMSGGWMNADEIRAREDLPDLPAGMGKTYFRPLNYAPMNKILDGSATAGGVVGAGQVTEGQGGPGGGIDGAPGATPAGGAKQAGDGSPSA